jgi:hypothetical protein
MTERVKTLDLPRRSSANAGYASGTNRLKTIAATVLAATLVLVAGCGADERGSVLERDEGSSAKDLQESSSVLDTPG